MIWSIHIEICVCCIHVRDTKFLNWLPQFQFTTVTTACHKIGDQVASYCKKIAAGYFIQTTQDAMPSNDHLYTQRYIVHQ